MIQQGQVFKLKAKGADGEPLWAYRYRLEGRASAGRRWVGSRRGPRLRGRFRTSSRGSGQAVERRRSRFASGSRSTCRCTRASPSPSPSCAGCLGRRPPRLASCASRSVSRAGLRLAADRSGRTQVRSHPGAQAGTQPRGRLEADRREPGQARGAEPGPALPEQRPFESWQQIRSRVCPILCVGVV